MRTWTPRRPLDDIYIKGLVWQHKGHITKAGMPGQRIDADLSSCFHMA